MIKVVFLGTPEIGASALQSLINSKLIDVVTVVTIPDKAIGRSHSELKPSSVASLASLNNLPIIKTNSINNDINKLKEYEFDYILTCAFGQFLSDEVLSLPRKRALNIHGSLLPEGRGGAPIHWSIINGKKETGISIMEMVSKMDAGDYFSQYKIDINDDETTDTLFEKMSKLILEKTSLGIIEIENGKQATKQDESKVSFWMNIKKTDSRIDFVNKNSKEIDNQVRGLTSKPGSWTTIDDKIVKIHKIKINSLNDNNYEPGVIIEINKNEIIVQAKKGKISIIELTLEGSKKNIVSNILNGRHSFEVGKIFK